MHNGNLPRHELEAQGPFWEDRDFRDTVFAALSGLESASCGLEQPGFPLDLSGQDAYTHAPVAHETQGDSTVNPRDLTLDGPFDPEMLEMAFYEKAPVDLGFVSVSLKPVPDLFDHGGAGIYDTPFPALPTGFPDHSPYFPAGAPIPDAPMVSVAFSQVSRVSDE